MKDIEVRVDDDDPQPLCPHCDEELAVVNNHRSHLKLFDNLHVFSRPHSRRVETTVSSLNSTRGIIVPPLNYLEEFPREMMLPELQRQFEFDDGTRKLPLAFTQYLDDPDYPDAEKPGPRLGVPLHHNPMQHPFGSAHWYDAVLFCNWLSRREGLASCYERTGEQEFSATYNQEYDAWRLVSDADGYRLPTEAEWEYACRAGTVTTYSHGNAELMDRYVVNRSSQTELPGSKLPNGWGLFDLHGNVYEWCHDLYGPYGSETTVADPLGSSQETRRVLRGGSHNHDAIQTQSAFRMSSDPACRNALYGFRVARTFLGEPPE